VVSVGKEWSLFENRLGLLSAEPKPRFNVIVLLDWLAHVSTNGIVGALANRALFFWRDRAEFHDQRLDVWNGSHPKQSARAGLDDNIPPLGGVRSRSRILRRWRRGLQIGMREVHVIVLLRLVLVTTVLEVANLIGVADQRKRESPTTSATRFSAIIAVALSSALATMARLLPLCPWSCP
jgi:hypothetical protein